MDANNQQITQRPASDSRCLAIETESITATESSEATYANSAADYWRTKLHDWPNLAFGSHRNMSLRNDDMEIVEFSFEPEIVDACRSFTRNSEVPPRLQFLGALFALVRAYTQQADILIGVHWPDHGLTADRTFIRENFDPRLTFVDLLGVLRASEDTLRQMLARAPEKSGAAFERELEYFFEYVDTDALRIDFAHGVAGLSVTVREMPDGFAGLIRYQKRLHLEQSVVQFARHYKTLLRQMLSRPVTPLSELSILDQTERGHILHHFNQTDCSYPFDGWIPDIIERRCREHPSMIALRFDGASMTYDELGKRSNGTARFLADQGIVSGAAVALLIHRSFELITSIIGIGRCGGAYVPIDPDFPMERITSILTLSGASIVLTSPDLLDRLPEGPWRCVIVDGNRIGAVPHGVASWDATNSNEIVVPLSPLRGDDAAYIIFTSGTTGQPKGVIIPHKSILNRIQWMQREYPLNHSDHVLQKTPLTFDVSVWELFWPLMTGSRMVLARPNGHRDPDYLCHLIEKETITTMHMVPSMLDVFVSAQNVKNCTSLKRVIASGEPLSNELVSRFFQIMGSCELHNLYGPTEAAVDVTYWDCRQEHSSNTIPIGRPISNVRVHILDVDGRPTPVGIVGELHIGGIALARGYAGRPDLTSERFIPDPFGLPGDRLYRTGDMCRYHEDGVIEYCGRVDSQVKIRGYRIELSEIEACLNRCNGVRSSAVTARSVGEIGVVLVAYITTDCEAADLIKRIKNELSFTLPDYMIPTFIIDMKEFPVNLNGKLDRSRLPLPSGYEHSNGRHRPSDQGVRTTTREHDLLTIWQDALGHDNVDLDDQFLELGGHSLMAIKIVAQIRRVLGVDISLRTLFEASTVRRVAAVLDSPLNAVDQPDAGIPPRSALPAMAVMASPIGYHESDRQTELDNQTEMPDCIPLSSAQRRLWLMHKLHGHNGGLNLPGLLIISGNTSDRQFRHAAAELLRRHDGLSITYRERFGSPTGRYQRFAVDDVMTIDRGDPPTDSEIVRLSSEPFSLETGPLWRLRVWRIDADTHLLFYCVHHLIADGQSLGILCDEITELLAGVPLGPQPRPYWQYSMWEQTQDALLLFNREADYWKQYFDIPLAPMELPYDSPIASSEASSPSVESIILSMDLKQALFELACRQSTTLYVVMFSAFVALLSRYTGSAHVHALTVGACRTNLRFDRTIGPLFNTMLMRAQVDRQLSFLEFLHLQTNQVLSALDHQNVPFEYLLSGSPLGKASGRKALEQILFAYQAPIHDKVTVGEITVRSKQLRYAHPKVDLTIIVIPRGNEIDIMMVHSENRFEKNTIRLILRQYQQLMLEIAADPKRRIGEYGC